MYSARSRVWFTRISLENHLGPIGGGAVSSTGKSGHHILHSLFLSLVVCGVTWETVRQHAPSQHADDACARARISYRADRGWTSRPRIATRHGIAWYFLQDQRFLPTSQVVHAPRCLCVWSVLCRSFALGSWMRVSTRSSGQKTACICWLAHMGLRKAFHSCYL